MPLLPELRRSDKLFIQPWSTREPLPRAQGFAPHAEHWRYPQNYCICPACPFPCCIPSPATAFPCTDNHESVTFSPSHKHIANHSDHVSSMLHPRLGEPASFVHAECVVLVSYLVRLRESPNSIYCFDLPHAAMHSPKFDALIAPRFSYTAASWSSTTDTSPALPLSYTRAPSTSPIASVKRSFSSAPSGCPLVMFAECFSKSSSD